jgi:hypothetical protein
MPTVAYPAIFCSGKPLVCRLLNSALRMPKLRLRHLPSYFFNSSDPVEVGISANFFFFNAVLPKFFVRPANSVAI